MRVPILLAAMVLGCAQPPHVQPFTPPVAGHARTELPEPTDLILHVLATGDIAVPGRAMLDPDHPAVQASEVPDRMFVPAVAFLVEHPEHGPFLVDAGFGRAFVGRRTGDLGWYTRSKVDVRVPVGHDLVSQVRAHGVEPDDLRFVVVSHGHVDHTGGLPDLDAPTVIIGRGEDEAIERPFALLRGYKKAHFAAAGRILAVDLDAGAALPGLGPAVDVFGDGSVFIVDARGHTPGHIAVLLNMREGPVLLAGDTVQTRRAFADAIPSGNVTDRDLAYEKARRFRALADRYPNLRVFGGHDREDALAAAAGKGTYR